MAIFHSQDEPLTSPATRFLFYSFFFLASLFTSFAQRKEKPDQRWGRPLYPSSLIRESDLNWQLLEDFVLMQKANNGDPVAQAELGYRLLLGKGFPADTAKAASWILKASLQGLPLAQFNMGILYNRGWGLPWDPFEAFRFFRLASDHDMSESTHILGLLYTEDLIVPRNWNEAYRLVKKAADEGYAPAKETLKELEKRGLGNQPAQSNNEGKNTADAGITKRAKPLPDSTLGFVFLNFHSDTSADVPDSTLAKEALQELETNAVPEFRTHEDKSTRSDSSWFRIVAEAAELGSPEALVLMGRCFEKGVVVPPDLIAAASYYIRAVRHDSPRGPHLLLALIQQPQFGSQLQTRATGNDAAALYVWAGLTALGFDKLLNEQQAFQLLQRAADKNYVPAMMELALCYSSGRWVKQDKQTAMQFWIRASKKGSLEGDIRIAMANIVGEFRTKDLKECIALVKNAAAGGSLIAETALAYCYEKGIEVKEDKGEAASLYRKCATRGSQSAYDALRRMHNEVRPKDKEFQLSE